MGNAGGFLDGCGSLPWGFGFHLRGVVKPIDVGHSLIERTKNVISEATCWKTIAGGVDGLDLGVQQRADAAIRTGSREGPRRFRE